MIVYRAAALVTATCLTGLSLAACSGGLTSAGSSTSSPAAAPTSSAPPAATSSAPSASASSAPPAATPSATSTGTGVTGSGSTVTVGGSIGTFPIPPGATVVDNGTDNGKIDIVLTGVTPQEVSTFYTAALPSAGYTITQNDTGSDATVSGVTIKFTGHGYEGDIGAASGVDIVGVSGLSGEDIGIQLTPQ